MPASDFSEIKAIYAALEERPLERAARGSRSAASFT